MSLRFAPTPLVAPSAAQNLAAVRNAQLTYARASIPREAFLTCGAAHGGLDQLVAGSAFAVTTGQQAGLFTGPLYGVQKALTAIAVAQALSQAWARPVVPVFWVAGDDHDFAEIESCAVLRQDGRTERVVFRERPADAPMRPAFREPLGPEVGQALAQLEAALPPSEFRGPVLGWLRAAYRPDHSMAEAFAQALAELLGPLGLVVLRGWHGAAKQAAGDHFIRALEQAGELDRQLQETAAALQAGGREAPVTVGEGLSLVMVEGRAGRDRLRNVEAGVFETRRSGERVTLADIRRLLRDEPERVSANVLLRPAVEAALVPTVAYIGGPGELAYLAQVGPVFKTLGVPRPVPLPRVSGMLVDDRTSKTLARAGMTEADLARPEHELVAAVARDALPPGASSALEEVRTRVATAFEVLEREAVAVDATLGRSVESARNQVLGAANEVEKKLLAALKRSSDSAVQQMVRARAALWPDGAPQERVLTYASFAARYGGEVLEVLSRAAVEHARLHVRG